jgi:alkylation response protein AidB-like acyl-CoA dehydrogenase
MFNEVFLDNVRIPVRNRVGEENEGWMASQMTSNFERSMIELFSLLKRDFEELVEYCREPRKGGDAPINNPLFRNKLTQLAIEIDVGRASSYFILWSQIKGGLVVAAPMACAAKVYGTELIQRLTYTGCQIMGLYGQVGESRWSPLKGLYEKEYQLCVGSNIAGGSSEIMRNIICSMGLGLPRSW